MRLIVTPERCFLPDVRTWGLTVNLYALRSEENWGAGDLGRFGDLMAQSGQSSIVCYECGSPQLITLYEILGDTPGVYGARFSGAGFRGNCIALIDPAARQTIAQAIHRRYPLAHPQEADKYSIHFCQPGGQARLMARSS